MTGQRHLLGSVDSEHGATLIEYALAGAIVFLALIWVNDLLVSTAQDRVSTSAKAVEEMAPCGGKLSNTECK